MRRHYLTTRRLLACQAGIAACAVCGMMGSTSLYDADLLARVCLPCGSDSGIAEIELHRAGITEPDSALIQSNPL